MDRYVGIYHHKHGLDVRPITHNNEKKFEKELDKEFDEKIEWDGMFNYVEIVGPFKWPGD